MKSNYHIIKQPHLTSISKKKREREREREIEREREKMIHPLSLSLTLRREYIKSYLSFNTHRERKREGERMIPPFSLSLSYSLFPLPHPASNTHFAIVNNPNYRVHPRLQDGCHLFLHQHLYLNHPLLLPSLPFTPF